MNRIKFITFLIAIAFVFFGCGPKKKGYLDNWMKEDQKIKILSTTTQIGDLVQGVGGERVNSLVLIQGDLNPHTYEIVKGDNEKVARADLIFYNGLGLEHGASLSSLLREKENSYPVGEWVLKQNGEKILKKGETVDPHIWMDLSLWKGVSSLIVEKLIEIDPEGADYYKKQKEQLDLKIDETHLKISKLLKEIPEEKRYLVTTHDAFEYFTRSYLANAEEKDWKKRFMAPEGLAPDGQLNPLDLQKIIDHIKEHKISVLFPESNVNQDSIYKIAMAGKEMGLEIRICEEPLYGDSTSGLTYLDSMLENAKVLSTHLKENHVRN